MPAGYCAAYLIELAIGGNTIAPFDRPEMVMKINLMKITEAGMCETGAVFRIFLLIKFPALYLLLSILFLSLDLDLSPTPPLPFPLSLSLSHAHVRTLTCARSS